MSLTNRKIIMKKLLLIVIALFAISNECLASATTARMQVDGHGFVIPNQYYDAGTDSYIVVSTAVGLPTSGGGGGSNGAAGTTGIPVPSAASYTGYQDGSGNTIGVSSLNPLPVTSPAGSATSAKQDTGNTSLGTLATNVPAKGQAIMTNSMPVVISSNQSTLNVADSSVVSAINSAALTPGPGLISNQTGTGASSSGTPRVTVANDSTLGLNAGTNVIGHVIVDVAPTTAVTGTFYQATQPVSNTQLPSSLGQTTAANSLPVVNPAAVTLTGPAAQSTVSTDMLTGNATSGASSWTDVSAYRSASIQLEGGAGISGGNVTIESTNDTTNALAGHTVIVFSATGSSGGAFSGAALTVGANSINSYNLALSERYLRVRINSAFTGGTAQAIALLSDKPMYQMIATNIVYGTSADGSAVSGAPVLVAGKIQTTAAVGVANGDVATIRMSSDGKQLTLPYAPPEQSWSYVAGAGGISNTTTAVTLQAAGAENVRNYLKHCNLAAGTLGAGGELAVRDGASGTVIWRGSVTTTGFPSGYDVDFNPPLRGSAATLMEFATLTASVSGALYINCQGYQAP
jgi:hypothetical protein